MASDSAVPEPSLLARAIGFFSGTVGLVIKLVLLGAVNALAVWAIGVPLRRREVAGSASSSERRWSLSTLSTSFPDRRLVPLKYLVPGTVFLVAFVVVPIVSNVNIAFTNWSTLHNLTKDEAIVGDRGAIPGRPRGRDDLHGDAGEEATASSCSCSTMTRPAISSWARRTVSSRWRPDPRPSRTARSSAAEGYEVDQGKRPLHDRRGAQRAQDPDGEDTFIKPEGLTIANEVRADPCLRPGERHVHGRRDRHGVLGQRRGSLRGRRRVHSSSRAGGRTSGSRTSRRSSPTRSSAIPSSGSSSGPSRSRSSPSSSSSRSASSSRSRSNKPGLKLRRTQRALLVLPFAIPAFLSVLVWQGLLNDEFGIVNQTLRTDIPWLFDPTWAKVSASSSTSGSGSRTGSSSAPARFWPCPRS